MRWFESFQSRDMSKIDIQWEIQDGRHSAGGAVIEWLHI